MPPPPPPIFACLRHCLKVTSRLASLTIVRPTAPFSPAAFLSAALPIRHGFSTSSPASLPMLRQRKFSTPKPVAGKGGRGRGGGRGATRGPAARTKPKPRAPLLDQNSVELSDKVRELRRNLHQPAPPPLRMARNRYLRHWTIHRAWQLYRRKLHADRHAQLARNWLGMRRACEVLRTIAGPGNHSEGHLFRAAMDRRDVYGPDGIPIEYARYQTETPGYKPWDHQWTR